jgi:CubicO group peptidase (beta-lactamase class C family)
MNTHKGLPIPFFSRWTRCALAAFFLAATVFTGLTGASALAARPDPMEARLDAAVAKALEEQRITGAVVAVSRQGRIVYRKAFGFADREANTPMRVDTLFRLASMTKPLVSATVLALADKGALSLDDSVAKWLPWFTPALPDGTRPEITIRQLLTHTAGLSYGFLQPPNGPYATAKVSDGLDRPGITLEENLRRLAGVALEFPPGSAFRYSLATDVLGAVAAKAGGDDLPGVVARLVTGPLGMFDTGFVVSSAARLARPYVRVQGALKPMADPDYMPFGASGVAFQPSRAFDPTAYPSGGAGMIGTADDYLAFLEAVRLGGKGIVRPQTARAMTVDQTGGLKVALAGDGWGFGYGAAVLLDPAAAKNPGHAGNWGWGGIYGTHFFMDKKAGLCVVVLTNTAPEGMIGPFPESIASAVYGKAP